MKQIWISTGVEFLKLRRSKVFLITLLIFLFMPLMMGMLMYISRHPELGERLGLLGEKAKLFTSNDWASFFDMMLRSIGAMSLLGFGFISAWVFGREHSDRTLKDLLSLPVSRTSIVISKFVVISIWSVLLSIVLFGMCLAEGFIQNLPGWNNSEFLNFTGNYFGVTALSLLLSPVMSLMAAFSKGIIAPLGLLIFVMILSQIVGVIGLGPYFPWAIPGLFAAPAGVPGMSLVLASYFILAITAFTTFSWTCYLWKNGDHT